MSRKHEEICGGCGEARGRCACPGGWPRDDESKPRETIGGRIAKFVIGTLLAVTVVALTIAALLEVSVGVIALVVVVAIVGFEIADKLDKLVKAVNKNTDEAVTTDELRRRDGR